MDISLIITTYNWKEALGVSLTSVLAQTVSPCEVIVADDGSRPDTGELVRRVAAEASVPVIHSWQEDRGFRLAMSRNRAIARARGAYIVLIDGDIILDRHDLLAEVQALTGCTHPLPARADSAPLRIQSCDRLLALGWKPGGMARLRATLPHLLC